MTQYVLVSQHQREEVLTEFQAIAQGLPEQIVERFEVYEYGLIGTRGALVAAGGA